MRCGTAISTALCAALALESAVAQIEYRPNREFRSLNTGLYEISIQKNGELDVRLASGEPVFDDAYPFVWYADDDRPEPMPIDGTRSGRFPVEDPLGRGNGMTLRKKECTWSIRTYPTQPFLAVQVAFENIRNKPVTIRALSPWSIGQPNKGLLTLGPGTREARIREASIGLAQRDAHGQRLGSRNLALLNATTGRSLIAGFLTHRTARAWLELGRDGPEKRPGVEHFRAVTHFDPPVTLEPGEVLESDVLYLGIAEENAVVGLERFVRAVQVANQLAADAGRPAHVWLTDGQPLSGINSHLEAAYPELLARPPRPVDLFESTHPEIWCWSDGSTVRPTILAVANDSDTTLRKLVPLSAAGLRVPGFYRVFDLRTSTYLGTVDSVLAVELRAGEKRLLSLVERRDQPQVVGRAPNPLATPAAQWTGAELRGSIAADSGAVEHVFVACDAPFRALNATSSQGNASIVQNGPVVTLTIEPRESGTIDWSINFEAAAQTP